MERNPDWKVFRNMPCTPPLPAQPSGLFYLNERHIYSQAQAQIHEHPQKRLAIAEEQTGVIFSALTVTMVL